MPASCPASKITPLPCATEIPVVIFSSLITEEMWIKGKQLGADEQLSKPEIGHLIDVMDGLLEKTKA